MTAFEDYLEATGFSAPQPHALWSVERAASPIIGTAIHNGHGVRSALAPLFALDAQARLREEDPYTEYAIRDVPNRVVVHRSRFEVDLNRGLDGAVYQRPEQAWGLSVWKHPPAGEVMTDSLGIHGAYYAMLETLLSGMAALHGGFVLLDIHSYNHRRAGPDAPPSDPGAAPVVNIGTASMDRERWAPVVDGFIEALAVRTMAGARIDVRENVAFEGRGEQTRFVHDRFACTGCAIAIEFKKVFMDEWTGEPDLAVLKEMRRAIAAALPVIEDRLEACL